ncbi:MAG TPA: BatA and WFA domain-containing protein, partial [Planctomycetia bacterium]|nr:BatA and WFA domain-containing protein [Planctomycetia bacterium]
MGGLQFLGALAPWQWAVAAAVPVGIFALYFLKLKRKPLEVPSTFLWKRSIEDLRVNSFWQRLRKNLLLLLQLLVAAAAILALTHPAFNARDEGKHWILAIDNSASMNATDGAPSRLDDARRKALEFIDQAGPADFAMVLAFSDTARVVCSYTTNKESARRAIRSIEPTARRTDLGEAFNIASGLANPQVDGEMGKEIFAEAVAATLVVFSDGRFSAMPAANLGRLDVQYVAVGKERNNVGIVRMSARRAQNGADQAEIFGAVRNYGPAPIETAARLEADGKPVDIQKISVGSNEEQSFLFRIQLGESARLKVKLDCTDALGLDNEAWAVIDAPRQVKVILVGDDNLILKTVLATAEFKTLAAVTTKPRSWADKDLAEDVEARGADLVIFDRCAPKGPPPCNCVYFAAVPPALAGVARTEVEGPNILNWNPSHPVLRFLSLDDVRISKAFTLPEQKGADRLIESERGAILLAVPRGVYVDLVHTFGLVDETGAWQTDWPLKLSFPLYVFNILNSLGGVENEAKRAVAPGDPIAFRGDEAVTEAVVTPPAGKTRTVKRAKAGTFEFLDTDEIGIYEAKIGEQTRRFAVNLADPAESDIAPAEKIGVGADAIRKRFAKQH